MSIKIDGIVYVGSKSDLSPFVNEINAVHAGLCSVTDIPNPPAGNFDGIIIHCISNAEDIDIQINFEDDIGGNGRIHDCSLKRS